MINTSQKLIAVMLLFYIIIANNMTKNLISHQLTTYIEESRYVQHIIGFIIMLALIMIVGGVNKIESGIVYALIGYTWFIFSTKLDVQWSMMIMLLLLFGFIYESKLEEKENNVLNDISLNDNEKEKIINNYNNHKMYVIGAIIALTVTGSTLYVNKKGVQYGGAFDTMTFIFG